MYFDTPRDYISGVYDDLVYGDHPLGWDILGRRETMQGATRETFLSYLDRWYTAKRMVIGVAGAIGDGLDEKLLELLGDLPEGGGGAPSPCAADAERESREALHEAVRPGAPLPRLSHARGRPPRPLHRRRPTRRPRRRHVLAPLHRGARAARARVLRPRDDPGLLGHRLALRTGRRRREARRRGGDDDRRRARRRSARSRCPPTSSRRRARIRRAASSSRSSRRRG